MSSFSKKYVVKPLLLGAGCVALTLTGCSGINPSSMPTGYVHHDKVYKSVNPIPSTRLSDDQRETMTAEQATQFRDAVYDLVDALTLRAGLPPKPVYVAAPQPMTPFYSNIDNDLREALLNSGYVLSDTPVESYVMSYKAYILEAPEPVIDENGDEITIEDYKNVRVSLNVSNGLGVDSRQLTEEVADYRIEGAEVLYIPEAMYEVLPYNDYLNWRPNEDDVKRTVLIE